MIGCAALHWVFRFGYFVLHCREEQVCCTAPPPLPSLYITMRSSSFPPGTSGVGILSLLSVVSAQSIPGASFLTGNGAPGAGAYQLVDDYEPSIFFEKFNFYNVRGCGMGIIRDHC